MYHCSIHFYLVGCPPEAAELLREMPPLARFTHEFAGSARPDPAQTAWADVILADLRELDVQETLRR